MIAEDISDEAVAELAGRRSDECRVQKCSRCARRYRGQANWNEDHIAGLVVGHVSRSGFA
jgi:hypothetical protein